MLSVNSPDLAEKIRSAALRLNYEKCGLIKLTEMNEYVEKVRQRLARYPDSEPVLGPVVEAADLKRRFPWAKSIIICARRYDNYNPPAPLQGRFSKYYLFDARRNRKAGDYQDALAFEQFLSDNKLRFAGGERGDLVMPGNRWAAMKAGLGIVRRNNFFYTEKGSWLFLESWLTDKELELKETPEVKPCPEKCGKCFKACPTKAIPEPYVFHLNVCVSYLTRRGGWDLTAEPHSPAMGSWLYGCDICQDVCPFNQAVRFGEDEFPGVGELAAMAGLENIVEFDYRTIKSELFPRFWSIPEDRLWKWKINALNAMKNNFCEAYQPAIEAARRDSSEQVRKMAWWVLDSVK